MVCDLLSELKEHLPSLKLLIMDLILFFFFFTVIVSCLDGVGRIIQSIIIFHLWLGAWFGLVGFISVHQDELKSICVLCVPLKHFCLLVYQLGRGHIWRDVRCDIHLKEYQVLYRSEGILDNVSAGTVGKIKVRLTRMRKKY